VNCCIRNPLFLTGGQSRSRHLYGRGKVTGAFVRKFLDRRKFILSSAKILRT